ncbi:MAG: hypothetical protein GY853_14470 [PVC group bacterium]|nr:hypothetical protein [PVC group bacterium]
MTFLEHYYEFNLKHEYIYGSGQFLDANLPTCETCEHFDKSKEMCDDLDGDMYFCKKPIGGEELYTSMENICSNHHIFNQFREKE